MRTVLELQWRWGGELLAIQHVPNVSRAVLTPSPQDGALAWPVRRRASFVVIPVHGDVLPQTLAQGETCTVAMGALTLAVGWVETSRVFGAHFGAVDVVLLQALGAVCGAVAMFAGLVGALPAPPTPAAELRHNVVTWLARQPPKPQRLPHGGRRPKPPGRIGNTVHKPVLAARPKGATRVDAATRAHNLAAARGAGVVALLSQRSGALSRVFSADLGGELEASLGALSNTNAAVASGSGGTLSRGHGPGGGGNAPLGLGQLGSGTARGPSGPGADIPLTAKKYIPVVGGCVGCGLTGDSLTRDEVDRVIRRHLSQIGYCYEKELQRSPIMGGKLVSQFTIGPTGQVVAVDVAEDSLGSDVVTACVSGVIRRMRFPAPRGGSTVEVNYPFVFQSAGN